MRCAQIQSSFLQQRVKTLQPGNEDQHGVGRNERGLADDRKEKPVVEKVVTQHHAVDALPEYQR